MPVATAGSNPYRCSTCGHKKMPLPLSFLPMSFDVPVRVTRRDDVPFQRCPPAAARRFANAFEQNAFET